MCNRNIMSLIACYWFSFETVTFEHFNSLSALCIFNVIQRQGKCNISLLKKLHNLYLLNVSPAFPAICLLQSAALGVYNFQCLKQAIILGIRKQKGKTQNHCIQTELCLSALVTMKLLMIHIQSVLSENAMRSLHSEVNCPRMPSREEVAELRDILTQTKWVD